MSRLELVVGPNGGGKSTFIELVLAPSSGRLPFVNADVIAKARWPEAAEEHSYEAARIASATRERLLARGDSFIAETVFSHPSKVDLIRSALTQGFDVHLHVVMVPEELSVHRVAHRAAAGGHAVPEEKIRDRYRRLWALVSEATRLSTTATFYDNSSNSGPVIAAEFAQGQPLSPARWPSWTPTELTTLCATRGGRDA
ncbi:AAA family ATPase [Tsukamurella sp. NPDC003166]|uniref:AAA family ATPase n=1 Tax=Tsukamurella sp. NPDC003166 TaxID=3154444 RepID=UPI0033BE4F4E